MARSAKPSTTRKKTAPRTAKPASKTVKTTKATKPTKSTKSAKTPKAKETAPAGGAARTVAEVMTASVATCQPAASLGDVARIMWEWDSGFVPVVSPTDRSLVGVVTDRDLCMAAAIGGRPLWEISVETAMTAEPVTCRAGASLASVHSALREHQVRRLAVVDERRRVVGIVSLGDLARHAAAQKTSSQRREVALSLGAISAPRKTAGKTLV